MEDLLDEEYSAKDGNDYNNEGPSLQKLVSEGYKFDFTRIFELGWKAMSKDIWWFILYSFVSLIILYASFITIIGWAFIMFPLLAGFALYAQKALNDEPRSFSTFFDGFKFFGPLLGLMGLYILISLILFSPVFFLMGPIWMTIIQSDLTDPDTFRDIALISQSGSIFLNLYQYTAQILLSALTIFSVPLIIFGKLNGWEALQWSVRISMRNFWWFVLLSFLIAIMQVAGVYACCIGLFFAFPFTECLKFAAYYDIVGLGDKRAFPEKPKEETSGYQR